MKLVRRAGIVANGIEFTSEKERQFIRTYTHLGPCTKLFWLHLIYVPAALFLINFWPPFHELLAVTDWIADVLPHQVFGILTISESMIEATGVTLPRSVVVHLIVEQILMFGFFLIWVLLRARKAWIFYPEFEAHCRRIYENYREVEEDRLKKTRKFFLPGILLFLLLTIYPLSSPELLLYGLEHVGGHGLIAFYAWGSMWSFCGLGLFWVMVIIHARRYARMIPTDGKYR